MKPDTIARDKQKILAVMKAQEDAWNNFDIPEFMDGYWNSDSLTFIGSSGITYGWQQTLDNYIKRYPDQDAMGILKFDILKLTPMSEDVYQMIGRYTLIRKKDKPSGYFTLIWRNINGKWVIVSDQTG